jgi:hypothetical protein
MILQKAHVEVATSQPALAGPSASLATHRQDALIAATATQPPAPAAGRAIGQNDIAIQQSGEPVEAIVRFHNALRELTGRRGIRDDVSRYEAVSLVLIDPVGANAGQVLPNYPHRCRLCPCLHRRYRDSPRRALRLGSATSPPNLMRRAFPQIYADWRERLHRGRRFIRSNRPHHV